MADYGMIGGIAQGLQTGLDTYTKLRQQQETNKRLDQAQQLQGLLSGAQKDDQGNWALTPEKQSEVDFNKSKYDPTNPYASSARSVGISTYKLANPKASDEDVNAAFPEGQSGAAYERTSGLLKPELTAQTKTNSLLTTLAARNAGTQGKDQTKATKDLRTSLEQMRGNPAVQQAEKDIYSSDKADSLANLYGDPNKLSPQQVNLLSTEIGKIAHGGSSTHAELDGITPHTLSGSMATITGNLMNSPTPANAAEWVKQYQDYTRALRKDAQNEITNRYGRLFDAYEDDVPSEKFGKLKDTYMGRFNKKGAPSAPAESQPSIDDIQAEMKRRGL